MRIPARLSILALVLLAGSLTACASRGHRGGRAHRGAQTTRGPLTAAHGDTRFCCPLYEVCVHFEGGMGPPLPYLLCEDCMGEVCQPGGSGTPCWHPPRRMMVRSIRLGNAVLSCRCECLSRVVIRVTPQGLFADLYPCQGPPCLHVPVRP